MKNLYIFIVLLLITSGLLSQNPFIRNYTPEEYVSSAQNWAITQDQRGIMYFGNSKGLLEYDGTNWQIIETPTTVRSLLTDSLNRIYVSLNSDFGYLQPDSIGSLYFVSLKDKLPKEHQEFEEVWNINIANEEVFFRNPDKLFILKNDSIRVITCSKRFLHSFSVNNQFYISDTDKGLMHYKSDSLHLIPGSKMFGEMAISSMMAYQQNKILICTRVNGIFIYDITTDSIYAPEYFQSINKLIRKHTAYTGITLFNGNFAIGTSNGGIIIFNEKGNIIDNYNLQNGLQDNSVWELYEDNNNQLWAALGTGISLIQNNLPFTIYNSNDGVEGTVLSITMYNNELYITTDQYIYKKNKHNKFDIVKNISGQTLNIYNARGKLLSANINNGVYEINKMKATALNTNLSASFCSLRDHPNYLLSNGYGLELLEFKNQHWKFKNIIKGFKKSIYTLKEDTNGYLWAFTYPGLYKLRLNASLDSVTVVTQYSSDKHNLKDDFTFPYQLNNGEMIFATEDGILQYLPEKDDFVKHPFLFSLKHTFPLVQDINGNIWFQENKQTKYELGHLVNKDGKTKIHKTPFYKFSKIEASCIYPYLDSIIYIGSNKGLMEYYPKQQPNYNNAFNTLIRKVFINNNLAYNGAIKEETVSPKIKYRENNIYFHYTASFYENSEENLYSYRLIGSDTNWSAWTKDYKKEYTNLYEGNYRFEVKSKNIYKKIGSIAFYSFEISSPWFRTWWSYALYFFSGMSFLFTVIKLNSKRLNFEKMRLEQIVKEQTLEVKTQNKQLQIKANEQNILNQKFFAQNIELEEQKKEIESIVEELKISNNTKDKFFSIIAHDLRSPFNAILGYSDMLIHNYTEFDDQEREKMIKAVNDSAIGAFKLLENLLTWSRSQSGMIKYKPKKFELQTSLKETIYDLQIHANKKNIKIINEIPNKTTVFADRNMIATVIRNLISNSIKFTKKNGTITVLSKSLASSKTIEISIKDTGIGISEDKIDDLFRIDKNTSTNGTDNERGTGLGLLLCKEFIEHHSGKIWAESKLGEGSTFYFTLPY